MVTLNDSTLLGNETPNDEALQIIARHISDDEGVNYYLAFDFQQKVMALTTERLFVADSDGNYAFWGYGTITGLPTPNHLREIVIRDDDGDEMTWRVGDASVAAFVRQEIRSRLDENSTSDVTPGDFQDDSNTSIADKVRFWEEQDKINQELIPRVIRQHELLTHHIAEHANLPAVVAQAVAQSLAEAKAEIAEQTQAILTQTKAELEQRYAAAFAETQAEIAAQTQSELERAEAGFNRESRQTRRRSIAIAAGALAISVASVIIGILI